MTEDNLELLVLLLLSTGYWDHSPELVGESNAK